MKQVGSSEFVKFLKCLNLLNQHLYDFTYPIIVYKSQVVYSNDGYWLGQDGVASSNIGNIFK